MEYSLGEITKSEKSIYSSVHLHGENHAGNNIRKNCDEPTAEEYFGEANKENVIVK